MLDLDFEQTRADWSWNDLVVYISALHDEGYYPAEISSIINMVSEAQNQIPKEVIASIRIYCSKKTDTVIEKNINTILSLRKKLLSQDWADTPDIVKFCSAYIGLPPSCIVGDLKLRTPRSEFARKLIIALMIDRCSGLKESEIVWEISKVLRSSYNVTNSLVKKSLRYKNNSSFQKELASFVYFYDAESPRLMRPHTPVTMTSDCREAGR